MPNVTLTGDDFRQWRKQAEEALVKDVGSRWRCSGNHTLILVGGKGRSCSVCSRSHCHTLCLECSQVGGTYDNIDSEGPERFKAPIYVCGSHSPPTDLRQ